MLSAARLALFGGSFDPVHNGHLAMAESVMKACEYSRVVFVPAGEAPHKDGAKAGVVHRVVMLRIALQGHDGFTVDEYEATQPGPSYTVNTLRHVISSGFCLGKPGLIIGTDLIDGFEQWREPGEIERLADLIVVKRPGTGLLSFSRRHTVIENEPWAISSSEIRERVLRGESIRGDVPSGVADYIEMNALYR